jgi:Zn-dependent M16 (insulinase) family peptidase
MTGIEYLFFLRKLAREVDADWEGVRTVLERIRSLLVDRAAMLCNVTTDAGNWQRFEPRLRGFLDKLPVSRSISEPWKIDIRPRHEGLVVPAKVNFVGKGGDLQRLGYRPNGATSVVLNHLNNTWLWEKVRVEGGAYGGSCGCDQRSGAFVFTSYRDPNLTATLDIYDKSADVLRATSIGDAELTRNIIGVIGKLDAYRTPDRKGWTSAANWLTGDTDELNQRWREEALGAGPADFRRLAEALAELARQGSVVVMGPEQAIAEANAGRSDKLQVTKVV